MRSECLRAQRMLACAVKSGALRRAKKCQRCGAKPKGRQLAGHHECYSKPLDVVWLCPLCHSQVHAELAPKTSVRLSVVKLDAAFDRCGVTDADKNSYWLKMIIDRSRCGRTILPRTAVLLCRFLKCELDDVTLKDTTEIADRRRKTGVTQTKLASAARVSVSYLNELERGVKTNPTLDVITRIERALAQFERRTSKARG